MPNIIETLATNFEMATTPSDLEPDVRVLIGSGMLVPLLAVYAAIVDDGGVEIFLSRYRMTAHSPNSIVF